MFEGGGAGGPQVPCGATGRPDRHTPTVSPQVLALTGAIEALLAIRPVELPGAQALVDAEAILAGLDRLKALALTRIADVEVRGLFADRGALSAPAWVGSLPGDLDRNQVALARRLVRAPQLAAAVTTGDLTLTAAIKIGQVLDAARPHTDRPSGLIDGQPGEQVLRAVIADGARQLLCESVGGLTDDDPRLAGWAWELDALARTTGSQIGRLEACFLLLARELPATHLPASLALLLDAILPLQLQDKADRAHAQRGLILTRNPDGSGFTISKGQLDLECGLLLQTVLAAATTTDPANPDDTARRAATRTDQQDQDTRVSHADTGQDPLPPAAPGDEPGETSGQLDGPPASARSRAEQAHDALKLALRRLLDSATLGTRDKAVPHLNITVPLAALHAEPGALPARAPSGTPLPARLLTRLLTDSALTRFVMSAGNRVHASSHTQRTLTAHERQALLLQCGQQCMHAHCPSPPGTPLTPHHGEPWATTHTTSTHDTVMLCDPSHDALHKAQRTLLLRDGRRLGPHGWITNDPG